MNGPPPKPRLELTGTVLSNKGDELMLRAVAHQLGDAYELVKGSRVDLAHLGYARIERRPALTEMLPLAGKLPLRRLFRAWYHAGGTWRPGASRRAASVAAFLDCHGFAYSDQWGYRPEFARLAAWYRRCRRRGGKVVFLPQTFGPFETPLLRATMREVLQPAHLVFARDRRSYEHVTDLRIPGLTVKVAPDFTSLVPGTAPSAPAAWARRVCVVPNVRMLDKTGDVHGERYLRLLRTCWEEVLRQGYEPVLLLHAHEDRALVEPLSLTLPHPVPVFDEDALSTKGLLGASYAVIGSRFHALVAALSQGVPALGTAWTHKFGELFGEYGVPTHLLGAGAEEEVRQQVRRLLEPPENAALRERLRVASDAFRERTRAMWAEIRETLAAP